MRVLNQGNRVIEAIIFDLNGTLLNDFAYNIRAFQMVFERFHLNIPEGEIGRLMGKPTSYIIEHVLKEKGIDANYMELAQEKVNNYIKITEGADLFFPEAKEVLDQLGKRYRLAMFTGVTRKQLNLLGDFLKVFEQVVAGEEAIRPKPDPSTLLRMAKEMGLRPEECAYVGDMPQDMLLARNAGMTGIGIENEVFSEEDLTEAGAKRVVRNLRELSACV